MGRYKIGAIYLNSKHYAEEAAETVGAPLLSEQVFVNRRTIQGKLSTLGEQAIEKLLKELNKKFPELKLQAKFDRYAGCSSCPCSPGYSIYMVTESKLDSWERPGKNDKFDCWADDNNKLDLRLAKYGRFSESYAKKKA